MTLNQTMIQVFHRKVKVRYLWDKDDRISIPIVIEVSKAGKKFVIEIKGTDISKEIKCIDEFVLLPHYWIVEKMDSFFSDTDPYLEAVVEFIESFKLEE